MSALELLLTSLDTLRASKLRAFLTTLGVIIGVLAITLLVAIGEGVRHYASETFAQLGANVLQISPGRSETSGGEVAPGSGVAHKLTRDDEQAIVRRVFSISGATGIVQDTASLRYHRRSRDCVTLGVGAQFPEIRSLQVASGRFLSDEDTAAHRRVVVIGQTIQQELFGTENPLGKVMKINDAEFRVVGRLEHKGNSLGSDIDDVAFIPSTAALDLFGLEGYTSLVVRARDRVSVRTTIGEISDVLKRRHNGHVDFTIVSQDDLLGTVNRVMAALNGVLLAIASISLIVGGIGIANIMLVSVRERTREIGVRRAVGATRRSILLQFLTESVVIALLGGAIGLGLGAVVVGVARLVAPALPLHISPWVASTAIGFSALVGVASGVMPARSAAGLDPVAALRFE